MRVDSIRLRLALWYAGIVAAALIAMAAATYGLLEQMAGMRAGGSLAETAAAVMQSGGRGGARLAEAVARYRAPDRRVILYAPDGTVLAASRPPPFGPPVADELFAAVPPRDALPLPRHHGRPATTTLRLADGPRVRVLARPVRRGGAVLAVLASTRAEDVLRAHARAALAMAVGVALLIAVVPGTLLVRRSLAPIAEMTRQASRIGAARLDERLPVANPRDELGVLARVFNDLLDRLQAAFARQRRFMAEAAHELRTPVAVVRAEVELALAAERSPAAYRDALAVVAGEAERLGRMVDDLLTISRAEAGEYPLRTGPMDLAAVAAGEVRALRALADARGVALEGRTDRPVPMEGDAALLGRMLRNLVENAVKHGRAGDTVRVETGREEDACVVRVADTGPGIPEEARERIWEPFHRGEAARAGEGQGGAGLGLPIARWIAEAHGGTLRIASTGPAGTVFEARLPAG